jgi:RND family efflux transporter MFP subunit
MKFSLILWFAATLSMITACAERGGKAPSQPPPPVTVTSPVQREVTDWLELTGYADAIEKVNIRSRVRGYIQKIAFEPRALVKKGDLLFVIDPRPFQAKVEEARAVLQGKQAELNLAQVELDKNKQLAKTQSISELKLIEMKAKRDLAKAEVEKARADLESAELELSYTHIKSPINGKVSRNLVDVGNLVNQEDSSILAYVVNDRSVYIYFNMSEQDLLPLVRKYEKLMKDQESKETLKDSPTPVYAALADEKGYPHEGRIDYADTRVDRSTGTIQLRAVLPNEKGSIFPGMYLKVRTPMDKFKAHLIPKTAILTDQAGKYVLCVNQDNTVSRVDVKTGGISDGMRIIKEGLKGDETIIVKGLQRARPGEKVSPSKLTEPEKKSEQEKSKTRKTNIKSGSDSGKPKKTAD